MVESGSSKRQVAYKVRVADILNNRYVKEDGWLPNYVAVGELKVSRANLLGVIVSKASQEGEKDGDGTASQDFILDDGSGRVSLRFFESARPLDVGDMVIVVGRPREFGTERYVVPEIVRKVDDPKWAELRKLELARRQHKQVDVSSQDDPDSSGEEKSGYVGNLDIETEDFADENPLSRIVKIIKDIDDGPGAEFDELNSRFGSDTEHHVKKLLEQGDVFEVKPGRYKVLE